MTRRAALAAAALAALVIMAAAGCGSGSGSDTSTVQVRTVKTQTRVQVIRQIGGGFDPSAIYSREAPGVVTVFSVLPGNGPSGGGQGIGSGFVLNGDGEIATNAHVVTDGEGAAIRKARSVYVAFADGNEVPAKIVGFDPNADVALLKIDPAGLTLRPLPLGTTRDLKVGSPVAAIGSPFNEPQSLSVGVVSAKDRSIQSLTNFRIEGAVQTDAAINRGNSGGPLVNAKGEVLGINSQIQTTTGGGEGVGYAVPIDTVKRSVRLLRRDGKVDYAYLGVSTARIYPQLAQRFKLPTAKGAWIQDVVGGGPADKAGLRAGHDQHVFQSRTVDDGGDIIVAVAGKPLKTEGDLGIDLLAYQPGQRVALSIYRGGKPRTVQVTLGKRPTEAGRSGKP